MEQEQTKRSLNHRFFAALIEFVLKHPKKIVILSVIFTILSVLAIALRFDIRSDMKDLMPPDSQVVKDMYAISDRKGISVVYRRYRRGRGVIPRQAISWAELVR